MTEASEHPRQLARNSQILRLDSGRTGVITRAKQTQFYAFLAPKCGSSQKTNPISRAKSSFEVGIFSGAPVAGAFGPGGRPGIAVATIRRDQCRLTRRRTRQTDTC